MSQFEWVLSFDLMVRRISARQIFQLLKRGTLLHLLSHQVLLVVVYDVGSGLLPLHLLVFEAL